MEDECDGVKFDIEIKNKKGAENVAADHLSRHENPHLEELKDDDIDDNFPDETLMNVSSTEEDKIPWFADFSNYLVGKFLEKAEAEGLPTNDARVVINFLKKLFSRFGIPKALISDRGEKQFLQLHELDELRLQAYENSKLYKARTKAYHDRKLRIQKEFKAGDKVLLYNSKYKFKAPKLRSKWYGPFVVKHGFPSGYVELYDKHGERFIVNGHRVKLYHDEEQINELTTEEIHLMCEQGKLKAIPFMAPFPADYRETMPWVAEKPFIYSVVENTCNEANLYDLDETGEGIVKGNFLYVKKDPSKKSPLGEK
ncbi:hypothetical protein Tco_0103023 [Tanacetum coccineum]